MKKQERKSAKEEDRRNVMPRIESREGRLLKNGTAGEMLVRGGGGVEEACVARFQE